ncbi:acyl-CoA dehydrogenase family protein [Pseudonocardia bannensis]|uniref:Acyl-CoA dehydrogenase n=1 Tax=Pseudonocardia bannensis TaxID=630973 RepID=A0A848DI21_9PSEU|nr:acyl-CoA dehydrogenase family protein [Pseudonocardia bannensis]NMH92193.1 acyl-CoA dehydrogenase [Pseudonocardia bannensis]
MSDNAELVELAESIFADARSTASESESGLDAGLWKTLEETGLARLTLPEAAGGSDGTLTDAAAVLSMAGAYAARIPLVETDLLAGWLAHAAGLETPSGPLTAVAADLTVTPSGEAGAAGARVTGLLARVPWARSAAAIVVLSGDHVLVLDRAAVTVTEGVNLAEEPRDTVTVDTGLDSGAVGTAPAGAAAEFRLRAALGRALLLAGAARGALAESVRYAGERVQFGRPIGRFQAVQQQLALAAAEVAAAAAATDAAARTAAVDGFGAASTAFAVAAAKARAGEAAGQVARIAHQVHGAIGFTREHHLRLVTTRLWSWRDEDGSDAQWNDEIGARVLAAGPDGLWPLVTGTP